MYGHRGERLTAAWKRNASGSRERTGESPEAANRAPGGFCGPWAPFLSVVRYRVQHGHVALDARLRRPEALTAPRAADLHETGCEINVLPLKPGDLAGSHPRLNPQAEQGREVRLEAVGRGEDRAQLPPDERVDLLHMGHPTPLHVRSPRSAAVAPLADLAATRPRDAPRPPRRVPASPRRSGPGSRSTRCRSRG